MVEKQQILLIHGGTTFESSDAYSEALRNKTIKLERILSRHDWKEDLQDQLGKDYLVYTPQMPNKQNAQYEEWRILLEKIMALLDDGLILIGHSLGGMFLVKYLAENKIGKKIDKTHILATPFDGEGMGEETLNSFLRKGELKNVEKQAGELFFYHSKDDFTVPFGHLARYRRELPTAHFREFEDRNHFLQAEIPELIADIKG
jgi:hypothetical protein